MFNFKLHRHHSLL